MAVEGNWRDIAFYLIHNGADVQAKNVLHRTPLHLAAANGRLEIGVMLLKAGADPHVTDINGWNPRQVCTHDYISTPYYSYSHTPYWTKRTKIRLLF